MAAQTPSPTLAKEGWEYTSEPAPGEPREPSPPSAWGQPKKTNGPSSEGRYHHSRLSLLRMYTAPPIAARRFHLLRYRWPRCWIAPSRVLGARCNHCISLTPAAAICSGEKKEEEKKKKKCGAASRMGWYSPWGPFTFIHGRFSLGVDVGSYSTACNSFG